MAMSSRSIRPVCALLLLGIGTSAHAADITVVPAVTKPLTTKQTAVAGVDKRANHTVYMVVLKEPSVLAFERLQFLLAVAF